VGEEILGYLLDGEQLVRLSPEVLLEGTVYQETVARVRQELKERGTITVAQVRDLFGTSRKYALALMEHLDAIGTTVREGDARRLS
jgi:selenocysteine-specific elongation factor